VKEVGAGQHVSHLAKTLHTRWDSVNTALLRYGSALVSADTKRLKRVACGILGKLKRHRRVWAVRP